MPTEEDRKFLMDLAERLADAHLGADANRVMEIALKIPADFSGKSEWSGVCC